MVASVTNVTNNICGSDFLHISIAQRTNQADYTLFLQIPRSLMKYITKDQ